MQDEPWDPQTVPVASAPEYAQPSQQSSHIPIFSKVIAIIDLCLGAGSLLTVPFSVLIGMAMLPEGNPLEDYVLVQLTLGVLIGAVAIAAGVGMLKKRPWAVGLGFTNIVLTVVGVIFIWVQMPAAIETQKMHLAQEMAKNPNATQMAVDMEGVMAASAVIGGAFSTLFRLALVVLLFIAVQKYKAWLAAGGERA